MECLKRSWAVVDLDRISYNVRTIHSLLQPGCRLMAVIKADGYGHGDRYIAEALARQGVGWFGVSNYEEALSLRTQGIRGDILIFGATPPEYAALLARHGLTQTVFSPDYARSLHRAAAAAGVRLPVHIKIDTGMSRLGFAPGQTEEVAKVCSLPQFAAEGIYTHFASADEQNPDAVSYTEGQFARFMQVIGRLEGMGTTFSIRHCCNSAGTINYPQMHLDMVRVGIALYGLSPSPGMDGKIPLQPAMELYSCISMVKEVPPGTPVSYGRTYTTAGTVRVATVAIGYADGYSRMLSGKARMLVRGQYANVIGRVCMDQLMLDVSHIPDVAEGDLVTIVGEDGDGSLSFDEMARLCGTINYEKVCLVGKRVPRIYRSGGREVALLDDLRNRPPAAAERK